jgi:hypothetical protein
MSHSPNVASVDKKGCPNANGQNSNINQVCSEAGRTKSSFLYSTEGLHKD